MRLKITIHRKFSPELSEKYVLAFQESNYSNVFLLQEHIKMKHNIQNPIEVRLGDYLLLPSDKINVLKLDDEIDIYEINENKEFYHVKSEFNKQKTNNQNRVNPLIQMKDIGSSSSKPFFELKSQNQFVPKKRMIKKEFDEYEPPFKKIKTELPSNRLMRNNTEENFILPNFDYKNRSSEPNSNQEVLEKQDNYSSENELEKGEREIEIERIIEKNSFNNKKAEWIQKKFRNVNISKEKSLSSIFLPGKIIKYTKSELGFNSSPKISNYYFAEIIEFRPDCKNILNSVLLLRQSIGLQINEILNLIIEINIEDDLSNDNCFPPILNKVNQQTNIRKKCVEDLEIKTKKILDACKPRQKFENNKKDAKLIEYSNHEGKNEITKKINDNSIRLNQPLNLLKKDNSTRNNFLIENNHNQVGEPNGKSYEIHPKEISIQNKNELLNKNGHTTADFQNLEKEKLDLHKAIKKQVEYYFSEENLKTDKYLQMMIAQCKDKYVPIQKIMKFRRVLTLTKDIKEFIVAIKDSEIVELSPDQAMIRQKIKPREIEDKLDLKETKQDELYDQISKENTVVRETESKNEAKENIS